MVRGFEPVQRIFQPARTTKDILAVYKHYHIFRSIGVSGIVNTISAIAELLQHACECKEVKHEEYDETDYRR